jgi:hypothetical protein
VVEQSRLPEAVAVVDTVTGLLRLQVLTVDAVEGEALQVISVAVREVRQADRLVTLVETLITHQSVQWFQVVAVVDLGQ